MFHLFRQRPLIALMIIPAAVYGMGISMIVIPAVMRHVVPIVVDSVVRTLH